MPYNVCTTKKMRSCIPIAHSGETITHSTTSTERAQLIPMMTMKSIISARERLTGPASGSGVCAPITGLFGDDCSPGQAPCQTGTCLDLGTAQWTMSHDEAAGLGTDTLPGSPWLYLPLKTPMRARGVLAVRPAQPRLLLVPEQRQQLETFAALLAVALERVHYVEVAQSATLQIESERLRNSLMVASSKDSISCISVIGT